MANGSALIASLRAATPSTPKTATSSFMSVATPWARNVGAPINFTAPAVPQPGAGSSINAIKAARAEKSAATQKKLQDKFIPKYRTESQYDKDTDQWIDVEVPYYGEDTTAPSEPLYPSDRPLINPPADSNYTPPDYYEEYDPVSDSWVQKEVQPVASATTAPTASSEPSAPSAPYVSPAVDYTQPEYREEYDPYTDMWNQVEVPSAAPEPTPVYQPQYQSVEQPAQPYQEPAFVAPTPAEQPQQITQPSEPVYDYQPQYSEYYDPYLDMWTQTEVPQQDNFASYAAPEPVLQPATETQFASPVEAPYDGQPQYSEYYDPYLDMWVQTQI